MCLPHVVHGMRCFAANIRTPLVIALLTMGSGFMPAHANDASEVLAFDVFLDQKPVGEQRFGIHRRGMQVTAVESVAAFEVRVIGIRAYRYRHQDSELWAGGCLQSIRASTDDNGSKLQVAGQRQGDAFRLDQPTTQTLPACVVSYSYWDPVRLLKQQRLLNPQTGALDAVQFESLGVETIQSRGTAVQAEHHRLQGAKFTIDLWYSLQGEWLQLTSTTKSKRMLHYYRK